MKKIAPFLLCLLIFLSSSLVLAQANQKAGSKKIGIALSGGGAKGLAHIGVLKVLEEAGIYPDYITGTSMGSVVGGLYAIGYSAADLEQLAKETNWEEYFTDVFDRNYLSIENKERAERYVFSFPFTGRNIELPKGFVDGQKLSLLLSNLTARAHAIQNFDDFKIPFRCVGTNLETGEAVVFKSGFLPDAIRCSIGIPTVFEPYEIDSALVVDGGVVRNLPVQDAQEMGADFVIAVDVGALLYSKNQLTSIISVLDQTSSFRIAESNKAQIKKADWVIRPEIENYSTLDFGQVDSLIAVGERAARQALPRIQATLAKQKWQSRQRIPNAVEAQGFDPSLLISEVEVIGLDEPSQKTFLDILQLKPPKRLDIKKLDEKLKRVIASNLFDRIDYRLLPTDEGYRLVIRSKKIDVNLLRVGVHYDSDFNAALLLNTTLKSGGFRNSNLSIDLRVSENPALLADYLVYTKRRPNLGLKVRSLINLFPGLFYEDNRLVDEFNYRHGQLRLDLFSGLRRDLSVSLGISTEFLSQSRKFFDIEEAEVNLRQSSFHFDFGYDTYNRSLFPKRGTQFRLSGKMAFSGRLKTGEDAGFSNSVRLNTYGLLHFNQVFPVSSKVIFQWNNSIGVSRYRATNSINLFYLGRSISYEPTFIAFSGFSYMERPAGRFTLSNLRLQVEVFREKFIALDYNHGYYLVPSFSVLEGEIVRKTEREDGALSGMGLELGANSSFGPLVFRTEYNFFTQQFNFLFHLGFYF